MNHWQTISSLNSADQRMNSFSDPFIFGNEVGIICSKQRALPYSGLAVRCRYLKGTWNLHTFSGLSTKQASTLRSPLYFGFFFLKLGKIKGHDRKTVFAIKFFKY